MVVEFLQVIRPKLLGQKGIIGQSALCFPLPLDLVNFQYSSDSFSGCSEANVNAYPALLFNLFNYLHCTTKIST